MKMSSCRWDFEESFVAQHRPQDVDPPTRNAIKAWVCFLPSRLSRS